MRDSPPLVGIDARAAVRAQVGGVERVAREMALRLPALRPDRYHVLTPPAALAHRAGHLWEQALAARTRRLSLLYCPANLAPLLSRRNVVVIHDAAALRYPRAYSLAYVAYQRRVLPAVARLARLVITVSEFARQELVDTLGLAPGRLRVIAPGVDARFSGDADHVLVAVKYGLERPYVLTVGTVSERKNLAVLEPAARALAERGIDLIVAGGERGYLRGAPLDLRRLGYVAEPDLPGLYAGARALAMPSGHEGFGLPCLEAMASGLPVVAARRGALPETVGEAGLLADPDDADAFTAAVLAAACQEDLRRTLAEKGRRRARAFTWDRTAALTDAAIGVLLGER